YNGAGNPLSLVVQIPGPSGTTGNGAPTGIVFNTNSGFVVSNGTTSGASRFLWATEEGVIAGWAPGVDPTHAIRAVDNSAAGAIYKGLTLAVTASGKRLYAAAFHTTHIDVYDATFTSVPLGAGAFTDPNLPVVFAPFNVQLIASKIYVSNAWQDAN